ncbi:MFS family permease [Saccharomonospora amisosensis]|uniref:MFS family permease n=1 Tax=Saccharomonospora amisosensis TaxID=1128677 RepID=A0A7X5UUH2_9PSEU|nr:MFS transporter [Saccharomonospora amisosensis]NIJ14492.1 MFS family permease [Saccharomonospora amisosensis]
MSTLWYQSRGRRIVVAVTSPTTSPTSPPTEHGSTLTTAGLLTLLLGAALPLVDFFIVNVALPAIGADLGANTATLELVIAGYGVTYAVLLVPGGRLGDAYGRKRLFKIGLAAFTVTSLGCGLAANIEVLVAARVAQAAAAALLLPQVLSVIQASTYGEHRSRAMGRYGANAGLSMIAGQLLGGVLVAADIAGLGWRPIFLVNVPIGLLGLLATRSVPESRSRDPLRVDLAGTALLGAALLCLLIPLTEGRALGWPAWTPASLAAVPLLLVALAVTQRRAERSGRVPLLPPTVLRVPSMRRGLAVTSVFFTGFGAFMFVCAVTLQEGLGFGPLGAGLALAPLAFGFFAASLASTRLVSRFGQAVAPAGFMIQLAGLLLLLAVVLPGWPGVTVLYLLPATLLCGVGQGLAVTTLFRLVLSGVPADSAGLGSGVLATTQQAALALGVGTLGSLFAEIAVSVGLREAFGLVIGLQAVLTVLVTVLGRALPDPRGGQEEAASDL